MSAIIVVERSGWLEPTLQALHAAGYDAEGFGSGEVGLGRLDEHPEKYALLVVGVLGGAVNETHLLEINAAMYGLPAIYHGSVSREYLAYIKTLARYVQKDFDTRQFDRLIAQVRRILK